MSDEITNLKERYLFGMVCFSILFILTIIISLLNAIEIISLNDDELWSLNLLYIGIITEILLFTFTFISKYKSMLGKGEDPCKTKNIYMEGLDG